jgi:porphobilinogen synthase
MSITQRPRRLRSSQARRDLVAEYRLSPENLMAPIFVHEALESPTEVASMPGVYQYPLSGLSSGLDEALASGISSVMLFAVPRHRDATGSEATNPHGILSLAVRSAKEHVGDRLVVIADLCLDEFTDHGHCGLLRNDGTVDNDATLERYAAAAIAQAGAGADVIAPSGMMDGQVGAIRAGLDTAGFVDTPILAYAAKYASAEYGPFRDAAECAPQFGDRRAYQMDPRNRREALIEVGLDLDEGADMVMVKPALAYLDVIADVRASTDVPIAAYHVSGEYAMLKAAAENGWIDGDAVALEHLTAIKRAGADFVLTYLAREIAERLS